VRELSEATLRRLAEPADDWLLDVPSLEGWRAACSVASVGRTRV